MASLDIFDTDAFTMRAMTASVNKQPHIPGQIGNLGVFMEQGIDTTLVFVEEYNGKLVLVPVSGRGSEGRAYGENRRTARPFTIPHIALQSSVMADEIQNVRSFGSETEMQTIEGKVATKTQPMLNSIDATIEHMMAGAIKGIVYDADGTTVIFNYFTEFNVTAQTEVAMDFANATDAQVINAIDGMKRNIRNELGGTVFGGYHAFCGPTYMDGLKASSAYRNTVQRIQDGALLNVDTVPRPGPGGGVAVERVWFQGVWWEEYQGTVGGINFIDDDTAHMFPTGSDVFATYFAPADYEETVNTLGLPRYARNWMMANGKGRYIEVQSNPLPMCLRPRALQPSRSGV